MEAIKVEELSNIEKKISIWVEPDKVNKKFDEFFNNIKKDAHLPGFRKGKAPVSLLRSHFYNKAKGVIAQNLSSEYYQEAVRQYNLNAVGKPIALDVDSHGSIGSFNEDKSYSVDLKVEVLPKIDPVGYDNIKLEMLQHDTDALVESKIKEYQNQFAERRQVLDAGCEIGDSLVLNFVGFVDGVAFDGGSADSFVIDTLGQGNLIGGFEEQMVGMKTNEKRRILVRFPDDYFATHMAGKDAEFDVEVLSIVRKTLAMIDNDLALMAGFETVEKMMEETRKTVETENKLNDVAASENKIVDHLIDSNTFDIPKALLQGEYERLMQTIKQPKVNDALVNQVKVAALKNVKRALILDAVYEKLGLEMTPDLLDVELTKQAQISGKSKDELVSLLYNSNQMEAFTSMIKNKLTVERLVELNQKKVEEVNG